MPSPRSVTVTVRFLARYAELVQRETLSVSAAEPATVESVLARLAEICPAARSLLPFHHATNHALAGSRISIENFPVLIR